jgi:hypothetical protein
MAEADSLFGDDAHAMGTRVRGSARYRRVRRTRNVAPTVKSVASARAAVAKTVEEGGDGFDMF